MIRSFAHKGLQQFFLTGTKAGINPQFAPKLREQLTQLNAASKPSTMNAPGYDLRELKGDKVGTWAVKVNGNWRLTFRFIGTDAEVVDLQDYH